MLRPREGAAAFLMDYDVRVVPTNIVEVREVTAPKGSAVLRRVLDAHESVASFEDCIRVVEQYEQQTDLHRNRYNRYTLTDLRQTRGSG